VQAAAWDLVWERGGAWSTRIARRAPSTEAEAILTLADPCTLELRPVDAATTTVATLTAAATVADDGAHADFVVTREQIEALTGRRYEHRIVITDEASGLPVVLLRGYVTVRDKVGD
jgi:DNA transposition AAA+ family ATPase